MSPKQDPRPKSRARQQGTSLVELMVAVAMVGLVLVAVGRFISGTRQSLIRQESNGTMVTLNERINANLRTSIGASVMLLLDDGTGTYGDIQSLLLSAIAASGLRTFPTRFANIVNVAVPPDAGPTTTDGLVWGNALALVSSLRPLTLTAYVLSATPNVAAAFDPNAINISAVNSSIERFQFVVIFMANDNSKTAANSDGNFPNLVEWRSKPYIDYESLTDLAAKNPTAFVDTCNTLIALGYDYAVSLPNLALTANLPNAFHTINASATLPVVTPPIPPGHAWGRLMDWAVAMDMRPNPLKPKRAIRGKAFPTTAEKDSNLGQAFNTSFTTSSSLSLIQLNGQSGPISVPLYARADLAGPGYPGGFETVVIGTPGVREIFARHVMMVRNGSDPRFKPRVYRAHELNARITVRNQR